MTLPGGPVTRALLAIARDVGDDRALAEEICRAAVVEQSTARALIAFPMLWGTVDVGVLDLYRSAPGSLDAVQRRDGDPAGAGHPVR